jgi:hypothetical protein
MGVLVSIKASGGFKHVVEGRVRGLREPRPIGRMGGFAAHGGYHRAVGGGGGCGAVARSVTRQHRTSR